MKASSEPTTPQPGASRIITAEALQGVAAFDLDELAPQAQAPMRKPSSRDLTNETARAAYALGRRRGFEQGSRSGLQQGFSEGSLALEDFQSRTAAEAARRMQQIADTFRESMTALEAQVATDIVSLAIDIAREVLRREPALDAQAVLPAAREALRLLGDGASRLELHLNPADAVHLRNEFAAHEAGPVVVEDAGLPRGSCRVDADTGMADAGFEARWHAVMGTLGRDEEPMP
ncbi:MAG: hypothetical protein H7255_12605 [Ramlibacter sp.]|nr:hypothetical protein [Ramlibacter sp.]